jgi:hypothetical protein
MRLVGRKAAQKALRQPAKSASYLTLLPDHVKKLAFLRKRNKKPWQVVRRRA